MEVMSFFFALWGSCESVLDVFVSSEQAHSSFVVGWGVHRYDMFVNGIRKGFKMYLILMIDRTLSLNKKNLIKFLPIYNIFAIF